ncbi:MAG: hypothetical protein WBF34_15230 [Streptosporangiaceae bacterium]
MKVTAAGTPVVRSRHEICELAQLVNTGECWQVPGQPCTPEGDHVARFGRAIRCRLVSGDDLIAVLQALDAFTSATIVCDIPRCLDTAARVRAPGDPGADH